MNITSSQFQTKQWRLSQLWYNNGKHNECEKFQISLIENITNTKLDTTKQRLDFSGKFQTSYDNLYEITENFDGIQIINDKIVLYNLKMCISNGGSQTRTLREVFHFIKCQTLALLIYPINSIIFINILDGDECFRNIKYFKKLETDNLFIGDLDTFRSKYDLLFY